MYVRMLMFVLACMFTRERMYVCVCLYVSVCMCVRACMHLRVSMSRHGFGDLLFLSKTFSHFRRRSCPACLKSILATVSKCRVMNRHC